MPSGWVIVGDLFALGFEKSGLRIERRGLFNSVMKCVIHNEEIVLQSCSFERSFSAAMEFQRERTNNVVEKERGRIDLIIVGSE